MRYVWLSLLFVNFLSMAGEIGWHQGVIVLADERIRTGAVSVDEENQLVLIACGDGRVDVLATHMIREVRYYEALSNLNRRFVTLDGEDNRPRRLVEVVVSGRMSVFRIRKPMAILTQNPNRDQYDYYVSIDDRVRPLTGFKLKPASSPFRDVPGLRSFIASERLVTHNPADIIRIIQYCNAQATSYESFSLR